MTESTSTATYVEPGVNPTALPESPLPALTGFTVPNFNGQSGVRLTPRKNTTAKGFAAASLCLGLLAALSFWVYPFGMIMGALAATMGVTSVLLGIRAGNEGQHLAWVGIVFGGMAFTNGVVIYRLWQLAFEGNVKLPFIAGY